MQSTDEKLIAAHLRGDPAAFEQLVRRYADSVLGYLFHMTGNRDEAEDLFQETFKRVHQKAHTFRGGHFKSWLFTIATRVGIDRSRRRRRLAVVSLDAQSDCGEDDSASLAARTVDDDAPDPADEALKAEQTARVRTAVESLPEKQRATLVLAYYQQLTYREVAEVLGCSIGTVKVQMSRALATLAHKLPESVSVTK
jgi:RNA polymerase sigma-70 factor (ECF subfamily)